ncbi:hypothetical protein D3C83_319830 [compost metagenome]
MEPLYELGAGEDHDHSHHERAHDAPEKHAVLVLFRDLEKGEYQEKDEEVVDRE